MFSRNSPVVRVPVVERQLLREAERHAARDDRDLVDGVGAGEELRDQRVAGLVVGGVPLLLEADDHAAALGAHHHLVLRDLEVEHLDLLVVVARGEQRRLVHEVLEVGAGEAGRAAREELDVDVVAERDAPRVHLEDAFAALHVGARHDHAAVEAAGAQQRGIEHVGAVGRGDQDDAFVRLEAVHLDEELVQGLLALVVPAAEAGAAVAADGVDLVDEDDAGRVLLALHEEVADARGADADEHLDEVRAARSRRTARPPRRRRRARGASCRCPGGPMSSTPFGMRPPSLVNFFGSFRKAMISSSSSFASSMPATSAKVTLFWFSVSSLARLLPKDIALPPPTCIWRMKKIHTPISRSIGNH